MGDARTGEVRTRIAGTGMYVPPRVVTNDDLAKLMDTSDEWITQRSGIKERHHIDPGMKPSDLAVNAANNAMEMAGISAKDLDCIIVPTLSSEHYFPGTAFFVQRKLGHSSIPALDIRAQCSGFMYGMQVADAFIRAGVYKKILLVGCEVHSTAVEFADRGRDVAVLFGDGAGAVILEPTTTEPGVRNVQIHAQGEHAERLWLQVPALAEHPCLTHQMLDEGRQYPQMDGRFVFKNACLRLPEALMEAMGKAELTDDDIKLYLFHQANLRINEFVGQMMGLAPEKCPYNIDKYGNCSSASIPILLDEQVRSGRLKRGDTFVACAFGSGFTWGSTAITF
jgi:3-oxoacyl-[acyl-carrier-protein] synthase-3